MEQLIINQNGQPVTTSRLIAEKFGKRHADVIRAIKDLKCSKEFAERNFALSLETRSLDNGGYKDDPFYLITRDGFSFLVMGFTGTEAAKFKEEFIGAFNLMDAQIRNPVANLSRLDIARMLLEAEEEKARILSENRLLELGNENKAATIELQEKELKTAAPKVLYHDEVLQSSSYITTTVIAKELGFSSAIAFNKKLADLGIQYRTSGDTWVLYSKYQGQGWTGTRTHVFSGSDGRSRTNIITVWTEKGRQYLHLLFKDLPTVAAVK